MALNFNEDFFSGVGGAVSSLFGAKGDKAQASSYTKAAAYSRQNAKTAAVATNLKGLQTDREIFKVLGGQRADVAGAGLAASGSALDILRSSMQEGEMQKQMIRTQGQIEQTAYKAEADAYTGQAEAAKMAGKAKKTSALGSIVSAGMALFGLSDRRLKKNIVEINIDRATGLKLYRFEYIGLPGVFEGFMADEVKDAYPEAVSVIPGTDILYVDYGQLGFDFKRVG